jgi:large subunit ribosomal protein L24
VILMIASSKPRKQRLFRYTAPMHERQKFAHAHISKELAAKLGIKKRSTGVRRGDTVKVMSGRNRGKSGKVLSVDLGRSVLFVEGIVKKNARGKEKQVPIATSNVYITDMDMSDKLRGAKMEGAKAAK